MEQLLPAESVTLLRELFLAHGADEDTAETLAKKFCINFGTQGYELMKPFFDLGWSVDEFNHWTYHHYTCLKHFLPIAPLIEKALLDSGCPPRFARAAVQYRVLLKANRPDKVAAAYHVLRPFMRNDLICMQALNRYAAGFLAETETLVAWIGRMQESHLNPVVDTTRVMGKFRAMNRQPSEKQDLTEAGEVPPKRRRGSRVPPQRPYQSPYTRGKWKRFLQG